jgi:hypothetical protein
MHTAKVLKKEFIFVEEVDADFEKCFGQKKCIEQTSRFEEYTSKHAKHSVRTRHNTNPRSEIFRMRGTTTNHIRNSKGKSLDLRCAVKSEKNDRG